MAQTIDTTGQNFAVGKRTRRKDAADKVRGLTRYAGDMPVAGLLHARLVLSPYAHARIVSIDTSAAKKIEGVVAVYTSETLGMAHRDSSSRSQSPLAQKEVLWCGHPIAIVLAETEAVAEDGAAAVDVDYEQLPVVIDPITAMLPGAPRARLQENDTTSEIAGGGAHAAVAEDEVADTDEELSQNVSDKAHYHEGNMESGWNEAEVVVERTYRTSFVHQSYIEPQSITVVPSTTGQQMTIWASSQGMFAVRSDVSEALHVPQRQIRVESVPIGGAFGGKFGLVEPLAAAAAFAARRPVRLVYTRSEDLLAGNPAPQSIITLKLGAKRDGTLVAMEGRVIFDTGAYAGSAVGLGGYLLGSTYRCPNLDIRCYEVLTNKVGVGAYRAPGAPQATYALESAVDELCSALHMDPVAFRLRNGLREGDATLDKRSPHWPRIGLLECVEKVQEHPLWAKRAGQKNAPPGLAGWKIGTGMAVGGWPGGTEPSAAACRLESDGTVTVIVGTVDLTGSDTSLALIAAQGLGMPASAVNVAHDNTDTMPYSGGTGGSKTTYSVGPAVLAAAQDARNQILATAAEMLEAASTDLEIEGDKVVVRGSPGKSIALKDIASASMQFAGRYEPIYGRGRAAIRRSSPMFGAHVARVAVDPETGQVRVLDYLVAQDVGLAINPAEVEGQIFGGVTQGIGWALLEGLVYDENGQLLTSTLMDYALPHIQDVPHFEAIMVEIPSDLGPFGAKGVGEPPVVPVGAAIANAIYDAVGVRVTQLPITPERLYSALH
ncbi:MAG TPA: xanthine dehydrogenase family protein molybdopterin-binding subunit [Ktedonobacteraceae bacterium]|jgi:CO/xanthine dehydrogenase Mo-binding subunit|nr:xanthine dehydrogenase family protein molybdopterin-binding subunit [Ktedonobacteraceae bacterium]